MNNISSLIEKAAKHGGYVVRWDYRDSMNKE